jgi:lysophospholipase L1-like esterase
MSTSSKIIIIGCITIIVLSKSFAEEYLIAQSQTGSMPLFFKPFQYRLSPITVNDFSDPDECLVRNGLPNFSKKISQAKGQIKVGYIGGSITRANDQYRGQSLDYLRQTFPKIDFQGINAGVSGTGTELGAFRIREQLLDYHPDLVFIEFAVNGGSVEALEGMVRQIMRHNPTTDICFIYTISGNQTTSYQQGELPVRIKNFETLAAYYGIPSIHLGLYPSKLIKEGKLNWRGPSGSVPKAFSSDGVHPNPEGGDLYAEAIARGFRKILNTKGVYRKGLPAKKTETDWENATMFNAYKILKNSGYTAIECLKKPDFIQFSGWFEHVILVKEGQSLNFEFKGNGFGLFDIGGPEAGALEFIIDNIPASFSKISEVQFQLNPNGAVYQINRFNSFCNNRYRGQFFWIDMPEGLHRITILVKKSTIDKPMILGSENLEDYKSRPDIYSLNQLVLGRILVKGDNVQMMINNE